MFIPKQTRCVQSKDGDGMHYIVPEEEGLRRNESPRVDVWWNRDPPKKVITVDKVGDKHHRITTRQEKLVIRQQNEEARADVIYLTPGQAYDLIDALCRAVENP